ncbi:hypothetical protein G3576_04060 [Roseomonas stagni]|uniref:Uncharacterized protein n=1 Tax=Falsiroseomonas algicola TaxID=2716930 RepID=A0A6M1LG81_9PROT|nr:hypothetical protein [Falsiroseomonas algicola]NGM19177.1 hypothetical protein [Falsiroseomonas algicola]
MSSGKPPPPDAFRLSGPVTVTEVLVCVVIWLALCWFPADLPRLARERWIAITGTSVQATVTGVTSGGERVPKRGHPFLVTLEAQLPDGRQVRTPAPVTLFSMSLDPDARDAHGGQRQRPPLLGETLAAYADARGAGRLVLEEALMRLGFALSWMSLIAAALIYGAWRARNLPPSP